jgi:caffeoyl-CoA O-methyltransferase
MQQAGVQYHMTKFLDELEQQCRSNPRAWSIPREEGKFLNLLVKAIKPRNILEIGTSLGYSTVWLGLAAKQTGAKVTTVEYDHGKAAAAAENFKRAGLSETIRIIEGDANEILKSLKGKFDFVFLDSHKQEYLKQCRMFIPLLARNAVIAADNAITHAESMQDYLAFVRSSRNIQSVTVPIGNGVELSYVETD